jgi:hypothetical protein
MKYRFFSPLILCGLLVMGFTTNSKSQTGQTPQGPRVSQNELNELAKSLAANGLQQYAYTTYTIDGKGAAKADKQKIVRAFFMMRRREFMKPLHNKFFDDGNGNLIYFGRFKSDLKHDVAYSITFAGSGDVIAAFDTNNDGLADGIIGRDSVNQSWSFTNERWFRAIKECFDAAAFGDETTLCGRRGDSKEPGSSARPDSMGAFVDDLSQTDCDAVADPTIYVGDIKKEAGDWSKIAVLARVQSEQARLDGHPVAELALREIRRIALQAHDDFLESQDRTVSAERRQAASDRYQIDVARYNDRLAAARSDHAALGGLVDRAPVFPRDTRVLPPARPGHGTHRPIGPDGKNEDPRCDNERKRIKQGLWFMSREFCPDRDFAGCWERAQDAVAESTDERCHIKPGPDGGNTIVCERSRDKTEGDPPAPPKPDPPGSPVDGPPLPFSIGPQVKLNYTYVSTTQLGAILGILCQTDRCGPMEGVKGARPGNRE